MPEFIPAILPSSVEDLEAKVKALPPEVPFFHLDVLDAVDGEDIWTNVSKAFEVHLMVHNPDEVFSLWIDRGARRIITHKVTDDILGHRGQVEIGLAFELDVPLETVIAEANYADFVHIMSISEIGAQGHPFDPLVFDRIEAIQERYPDLPISVDGGITAENYKKLVDLGADRLIVGSHFKQIWDSVINK